MLNQHNEYFITHSSALVPAVLAFSKWETNDL